MKQLVACIVVLTLILPLTAAAANIYVAVNGSDKNAGTKDAPFTTVARALRKAREMRRLNNPSVFNGIHIIVGGGVYQFYEPLFIRSEDAGTKESPTYMEAAANEQPVFSGGISITGWHLLKENIGGLPAVARGKVWVADVPVQNGVPLNFRQFWVNNIKAVRAKDGNGDTMHRILSWDHTTGTCWIPTPHTNDLANASSLEMFIHQWWATAVLRVKKIEVHGDSSKLSFYQPESNIQNEHPWPAPWISTETGNSAFYLTNAIQFLDEPGEWYLDVAHQKIYYWPRKSERLSTATVTAPVLETLVKMEGTIDHPVQHFFINGIAFEHTGWLRPSQQGHVPHQAGFFMTDAYKLKPAGTTDKPNLDNQAWIGRPAAAVQVNYAENVTISNCRFEHLASTGLDFNKGTHNNTVIGNLFKDIGGSSILAGVFTDEGAEIHQTYNPTDDREVCDSMHISNNLITDVTNEDWGCVGIGLGYTKNSLVEHNEVENVSYTGISMGWGWNAAPNAMKNNRIIVNKIHHYGKHNYDCSGIYTLSAQANSFIEENYVDSIFKAPYAHLPSHWFYLYTDEGSSYLTIKNNWTPSTKYLQNANGPGNMWSNNGPQVDAAIKQNSGLQPQYQSLLKEKTASTVKQSINQQHKEIIEIITQQNDALNIEKLQQLLAENNIDSNALYQWHNHYVIFDNIADPGNMQSKLHKAFPDANVKAYFNMYYQFSKQQHCTDTVVAKDWDNIILTANLVADKKAQEQYLAYHATQFEQFPGVTKGFCNADFQQLLCFKSGRQLMLVISIPKGKTLDGLNPRTTEGNPQMMKWNTLMSKYQEGIEGTKPGEVWVFFKQIHNN
ncbi:right-handed parallel beta-helix repeat-containing protein [Ilyomonas limi]|uniref:Right-handed parallel beta-helix repeat-containing protein n=1 Tax=Ilyomonas limi TaxID=2575867 RepID=A0A4U3L0M3_9BACT|nr:right-handed parallel beta-helix repeat-containing protein [Ilyomonas limi]TKK67026.1 right-handed parallel beta-helix repeat-containing protein [Ilyomonas limi]